MKNSLSQPRGEDVGENVCEHSDKEENARTIDHVLVKLFRFTNREPGWPHAVRIVQVVRHWFLLCFSKGATQPWADQTTAGNYALCIR